MHIRLLAFGSRGDVQPYIALGLGLRRAGFEVSLAAAANFKTFVESYGLPCLTAGTDIETIIRDQAGGSRRKAKWIFLQMMLDETLRLSQGADAIVYAPAAIFSAPHVAEKLGIPAIPTALQPFMHPTDLYPAVGLPALSLGGWYNRLTYKFVDDLTWTFTRSRINRWRAETLDLPPAEQSPIKTVRQSGLPVLYGFSPAVLPRPAEWDASVHITGYWVLPAPAGWTPPPALVDFLNAGLPPVYIGFGSMASTDAAHTAQLVLEAVKSSGVRAVLASGWGGLAPDAVPDDVLLIDSAPHDWLFPHCVAVVHHGGAGTTASGLRAGIPSIIVPFRADQPFWGARVHGLGVGPQPIPQRQLTAVALAAALREATQETTMREKAAALGAIIQREDGVSTAVSIIQTALHQPRE